MLCYAQFSSFGPSVMLSATFDSFELICQVGVLSNYNDFISLRLNKRYRKASTVTYMAIKYGTKLSKLYFLSTLCHPGNRFIGFERLNFTSQS